MSLRILEGLYYLVTIAVSFGFLHNIFNTLIISSNLEIIFINKPQRFLLKIWFFIKFFLSYIYICIVSVYIINSLKIGFYLVDFFTFSLFLFFCDYVHLSLFAKTPLLKLYSNFIKKLGKITKYSLIAILSILLIALFHFIENFINKRSIYILQLICFFIFAGFCNEERKIIIKGKLFKFNFINLSLILLPLFIKTLLIFNNNSIFYIKIKSNTDGVVLSDISNYISEIFNNTESVNILFAIFIISILVAIFCVKKVINLPSFIIHKNKIWKIKSITIDKYAICHWGNYMFAIKIEDIKNNYYCEYREGNFYFRSNDEMTKIEIEDNSVKNKSKILLL